ncbi:hypothetical protein [Sphingomonas sp.]|uniref:hypothetical protein n=1 Tax=Sphingomonas sp. TaxID=28214 RepID=UPI002DD641F0|nr:hypothetical protein [Sphingomonas sp.]
MAQRDAPRPRQPRLTPQAHRIDKTGPQPGKPHIAQVERQSRQPARAGADNDRAEKSAFRLRNSRNADPRRTQKNRQAIGLTVFYWLRGQDLNL